MHTMHQNITHFVFVVDHFKASTVALPLSFQAHVSKPRWFVVFHSNDLVFAYTIFCVCFIFLIFLLGFSWPVLARSSSSEDQLLEGLPKEYYDDVSGCLCSISYVVYFRLTGSKLENEKLTNLLIRDGKVASFVFYSQTHARFSPCTTKSLICKCFCLCYSQR